MIAWSLIIAAGLLTRAAVRFAAVAEHWRPRAAASAGVAAGVLIIAWRGIYNTLGLNGDFIPLVSIGDVGCLVAGAAGPAAVALLAAMPSRGRWLPAAVGGLAGFAFNVVIL
jgi:hypothetical protein